MITGLHTSGRLSFELDRRLALAGFARQGYTNVHTNPARVTYPAGRGIREVWISRSTTFATSDARVTI